MLDSFVAGIIGSPFGVRGFVKVRVPSGETGHLESLKTARLRIKGAERNYEVEGTGGAPASFVMKFRGVDTREAAALLTGAELIVLREAAAPLEGDEFYIEDLRGTAVVILREEEEPEVLGEIVDVLEGGGGQLVEVRVKDGSTRLVPFRNEFFGDIDLSKRTAVLRDRWMLE